MVRAKSPDPTIIAQNNERARLIGIESQLNLRNKWLALRAEHTKLGRRWGINAANRQIAKIDARLLELGHIIGSD